MLLVTGAAGFLGTNVLRAAAAQGREVVAAVRVGHTSVPTAGLVHADLTDKAVVREMIASVRPQWVLNCAALANLDECEKNPTKARAMNATAPANIAAACAEFGARLVQISTDSVFDGNRGMYSEDDIPSPVNIYASSKLEGERAVRRALPGALVVRTNFIGLPVKSGAGLADWIAGSIEGGTPIEGFGDVIFSPLLATTLAERLFNMMDAGLHGLYHLGASDSISKYHLAVLIASEMGINDAAILRTSLSEKPMTVRRPLNTSLISRRAERALGNRMPTVNDAVRGFVAQRRSSQSTVEA
ncbi:MAG TPA: SDR family oxidoreductase [Gemmatimonadaceae bacterium]|nr:SDR family oxidoreductase [Gemmatimonadaceae bacterium]